MVTTSNSCSVIVCSCEKQKSMSTTFQYILLDNSTSSLRVSPSFSLLFLIFSQAQNLSSSSLLRILSSSSSRLLLYSYLSIIFVFFFSSHFHVFSHFSHLFSFFTILIYPQLFSSILNFSHLFTSILCLISLFSLSYLFFFLLLSSL